MLDQTGVPVDHHHARGRAILKWTAGDELLGELVVEISSLEHGAESHVRSFQFQVSSKSM